MIAAVGAAFALSFDTISHALVFSITGASLAGWAFAAILGVVFTCGMALTDAASGLWVARLVRSADQRAAAASRIMSIAVAFLCLALADPYGVVTGFAFPFAVTGARRRVQKFDANVFGRNVLTLRSLKEADSRITEAPRCL